MVYRLIDAIYFLQRFTLQITKLCYNINNNKKCSKNHETQISQIITSYVQFLKLLETVL